MYNIYIYIYYIYIFIHIILNLTLYIYIYIYIINIYTYIYVGSYLRTYDLYLGRILCDSYPSRSTLFKISNTNYMAYIS